jgi:hypothetical protein
MSKGRWAVIDCANFPSDSNCQIKMMSPEDRMDDLIEASCGHVCQVHGGKDNKETREMIREGIEIKEM